ncbi:MAG: R3H domain-containing nucleic acid-binding protein [Candidatus Spechtbacterales bacterium]
MSTEAQLKKDIKEFVDKMTFNLLHDPEVKRTDERFLVHVFVDEPRAFIGERGANLRDVQSLFRMVVNKKYGPEVQVDLDVNGYKQRRAEFLKEFALTARRRVLDGENLLEMEPMNGFDRRIIHTTLADFDDVETESVGEHPYRKVVVRSV